MSTMDYGYGYGILFRIVSIHSYKSTGKWEMADNRSASGKMMDFQFVE